MKKLIISATILLATYVTSQAQVQFKAEFGASPASNSTSAGIIVNRNNPHEEFQFNQTQVKPQFYGGIRANIKLGTPFFLETGISYTKRTAEFHLDYTMPLPENPTGEMYVSESEDMLLFPLDIGVSMGKLEVTSGLTAIKTISAIKELSHVKGFHSDGNSLKMGWQMGVRYGINRTQIGIEYQGSLNRVGQGMSVNGNSLEIMNVPGKMVFTMQYRF
jgi:hypothetical protein